MASQPIYLHPPAPLFQHPSQPVPQMGWPRTVSPQPWGVAAPFSLALPVPPPPMLHLHAFPPQPHGPRQVPFHAPRPSPPKALLVPEAPARKPVTVANPIQERLTPESRPESLIVAKPPSHSHPHPHPHSATKPNSPEEPAKGWGARLKKIGWKNLATAAGLFLGGRALYKILPSKAAQSARILSADWKDWARLVMGIVTVDQINKGFNWKPPGWLGGMEAAAVLHPLAVGFSTAGMRQLFWMAPLVGVVVGVNNVLNDRLGPWLKENANIPELVSKVAISAGMITLGVLAAGRLFMGVCLRGCCTGSMICFTEIAEMFAGLKAGHDHKQARKAGH